jgi:hypothetical protein
MGRGDFAKTLLDKEIHKRVKQAKTLLLEALNFIPKRKVFGRLNDVVVIERALRAIDQVRLLTPIYEENKIDITNGRGLVFLIRSSIDKMRPSITRISDICSNLEKDQDLLKEFNSTASKLLKIGSLLGSSNPEGLGEDIGLVQSQLLGLLDVFQNLKGLEGTRGSKVKADLKAVLGLLEDTKSTRLKIRIEPSAPASKIQFKPKSDSGN